MNHEKDEQSFLSNLKSKIQENSFQGFFKNHLQLKNNTRNSRNSRMLTSLSSLNAFKNAVNYLLCTTKIICEKKKAS